MNDHTINAARVFMGDSLGFHIIFVMFSLTLPVLVSWFEFMGIRKKDPHLTAIAKFWSKIMTISVIVGVISGTIIALQMSLVWPGILKFGGEVIGLPFLFETYAFLIEAVFLALYLVTWNNKKVSAWLHWFFGLFVILGSTMSAFVITSVNAWMNNPTGFSFVDGNIKNVNVWHAMFSETSFVEFFHSMPGYYFAVSLCIIGMYVVKILRSKQNDRNSKRHSYDWFIVARLGMFAIVMFAVTAIMSDVTGKYLAKHEPVKLAALELNYNTQSNAPLLIGGVAGSNDTVVGPHIKVPGGLSFLAGNSKDTVVKGLNDFPENERPPLYVHTLFDIKMTIITFFASLAVIYGLIRVWRPEVRKKTIVLLPLTVCGVLATTVMELGWMMTEIGRQPWAVRGYVTTSEAITKTNVITNYGYFFPLSYVALFIVTILALKKIIKDQTKIDGGNK